ncbi:MAG TPA: ABC transporter ATP-binding protein [Bacteroidales bacterium]|nr:ABC transporter ATP-binding protein [Bacteroidales bacterium]HPS63502.1 ABC transporter ATP-binding protein [Bacteroidales bacterium]
MKEALHPLKKKYHKEFYALNDLSLEVRRGEILGIVGMNGSGKSTLLKIIAGIIPPTAGEVQVQGNVVPLLELGAGFNPEFTGLENIYFYNSIMGFTRRETDAMLDKILNFAEIGDFIHQPLKTYSSGMKARLSFAVSVNINPDILIIDEVLSVGDELFRRKSFSKIEEFFQAGKTILFVSHSAQNINQLCTRALMLYNGRIVLDGPAKAVTMQYNRFIFSRQEQREILLEEFRRNGVRNDLIDELQEENAEEVLPIRKEAAPVVSEIKSEAYFIDNFDPKSTVVTRNADLDLENIRLEDPSGREVNSIVPGEEYSVCYRIRFSEDVGHISQGIGFKTELGVVVTWRYSPECNRYSERYFRQGDVLDVRWKFRCNLIPATYFTGITLKRQTDEGGEVIFKGADIDVFQVLGVKGVDRGGYFDAGFTVEME